MTADRTTDKIRKLLAMGNDDRANETERETALRQAHSLMVKHNLTVADVGDSSTQEQREERKSQLSVYPWARGMAYSIAQLFFCAYYFQRNGTGKLATHAFIGKQSNAVTAQEMSEYVVSSVFKELRKRFGSETSPDARSFAVGVEASIRRRCADLRREAEQADKAATQAAQAAQAGAVMDGPDGEPVLLAAPAASTSRALALASVYVAEEKANAEWLEQHVGKLKTAADRTKGVKSSAYHEGRAHGNGISLNRQVGTTGAAKCLK